MTIDLKDLGYIVRPAIWVKDRATSKRVTTVVYFLPGSEAAAKEVARELGGVEVVKLTSQIPTDTDNLGEANVVILLGSDIAGKPLRTAVAELPAGQTRYKCWGAIEQICVEI